MKDIAYLILAHTDPDQLARLVRALDYRARIFVHLDAKSDLSEFRSRDLPPGVSFIENRARVSWAAFSQVGASLRMMRAALESGHPFSHLVMLSGLDYPIKPVQQLHEFLNAHPQHEFIRFINVSLSRRYRPFFEHYWFLENLPFIPRKLDYYLRHGFGRALRLFLKKPQPPGMEPCWGSAYWALTPKCAAHILDFTDKRTDYVRWARSSYAVDEHYFHTIVGNSSFCVNADGFTPYAGQWPHELANLHLIHHSLRKVYTEEDYDELYGSTKFFVRKVVSGQFNGLVARLDNEILHPAVGELGPKNKTPSA